jgi:hypothetical protein
MQRRRKVVAVKHEYYKRLCALSVAWPVSKKQFLGLLRHLERCEDCRDMVGDFLAIADMLRNLRVREKRKALNN